MKPINIHQAKTHLIPISPSKKCRLGTLKGKIKIAEDFDAPLLLVAQAMSEPLILQSVDRQVLDYFSSSRSVSTS